MSSWFDKERRAEIGMAHSNDEAAKAKLRKRADQKARRIAAKLPRVGKDKLRKKRRKKGE